MTNVKIYGADTGRFGTGRDGLERFWRNLIGGMASARFHRPSSGLGLSAPAQAHLKSARMLANAFGFFQAKPDAHSKRLLDRGENEAYLTSVPSRQYAVYFPDGGSVRLDLAGVTSPFGLRWLEIAQSRWQDAATIADGGPVPLTAPGPGHWVALLRKAADR
jgi:hypothetical protein